MAVRRTIPLVPYPVMRGRLFPAEQGHMPAHAFCSIGRNSQRRIVAQADRNALRLGEHNGRAGGSECKRQRLRFGDIAQRYRVATARVVGDVKLDRLDDAPDASPASLESVTPSR